MTVKFDTTLKKYEEDGGDKKFIKDVTKSVGIDSSSMKITKKREGSVILDFTVKGDQNTSADVLKGKVKNALYNDIAYPVQAIEEKNDENIIIKYETRDKVVEETD